MESRPSARSPDVTVVVPQGRLDASASPRLERALANCEAQGLLKIVLNFSDTNYISSSSLRVILMHTRKLRQQGGDLKLCCLTDKISQVLSITGLDTILEVFADEELAVQAFEQPSPSAHLPLHGH
jgi:anti-sigma B factor antagonist